MTRKSCLAAVAWLAWCGGLVADKTALDRMLEELSAVRGFEEVKISPDGAQIAWVERLPSKDKDSAAGSAIYVTALGSRSQPRRVGAGDGKAAYSESHVAWSPDGKRLAFLSDREKANQRQLYIVDTHGGAARKLTNLTGFLADPQWAPDGRHVALLFTENAPRVAGPLAPVTPGAGVVEERIYEQRLTLIDVESHSVKQISPADLYVYEYDWSPDSKNLAMTAAHGSGDNNWYIASLYRIAADSGAVQEMLRPKMQIAAPRWSPDGTAVAFIGGLMSDEGSTGGDIFVLPAGGGPARDITPDLKASASTLMWRSDSQLLFTEVVDGGSGLAYTSAQGGPVETLWRGNESIGISLARDGRTSAAIRRSWTLPPEVWAGPIGAWKQITFVNRDRHPQWGEARSMHWTSDGTRVQGWLLFPQHYDPKQRYPMVVSVHGGPGAAKLPAWPSVGMEPALLSEAGYFVLYPNPRGSFGEGESFTRGNVKDFGGGDLRDILAGVDEIVKTLPVDRGRVGITGWSYGGYMTMWAVTQTDLFRAAVAGAGIANWQSYYGENAIDQWMLPYFGASVYDDPAVYAKSSPINFVKNVKAPTLVLVGDRDGECPAPQSYEFWHALKTLGVKTELVVYPNEGHQIRLPEHQRDVNRRMLEWFERYLR